MNAIDRQRVMEVASILRMEARNYYDKYKHNMDARANHLVKQAFLDMERYTFLSKIAAELDIIAQDNL